jgi:mRNA interferase MazF
MGMRIKRGDIVLVDLDPVKGSEQGKTRPAVVIQNDIGNEYSPTTIVAPITSKVFSQDYPTNVFLSKGTTKLPKDSTIMTNQIRTIDKSRIIKRIDTLDYSTQTHLNSAIKVSLAL